MQLISSIALTAALIAAPAALAQTTPQAPAQTAPQTAPTTPAAPAAAAAAPVTDAEVTQFATAAIAAGKINADTTIAAADKTDRIVAAITGSGLTAERFNQIAQMIPGDPALDKRIKDEAGKQSAAAKPAQ